MITDNTIVKTYNGKNATRKECRFIKGEFYVKNVDCFNINGTWYRINSGMIARDHESGDVKLIADSGMVKGLISYNNTDGFTVGYFTPKKMRNVDVIVSEGKKMTAISQYIIPSDKFVFDNTNMCFVKKPSSMTGLEKCSKPVKSFGKGNNIYGDLPYNARNFKPDLLEDLTEASIEYLRQVPVTTSIGTLLSNDKIIERLFGYSYGVEFETSYGQIPWHMLKEGGLIPLRDGSISGVEYATIPYFAKDHTVITGIERSCETLKAFTAFDLMDSLHIHIGSLKDTSKEFIGILYTVCCILEDEIYSMFPQNYAKTSMFKQKDYNMPLMSNLVCNDPNKTFDNISVYLSAGKPYMGAGGNHPSDPDGQRKFNINQRYHWCNFIPTLFGSSRTVEFRLHTPTNNPVKIINWMMICSSIIKIAEIIKRDRTSMSAIRGLTLDGVLKTVFKESTSANAMDIYQYLGDYVKLRKNNRKEDDMHGSLNGEREIRDDHVNVDIRIANLVGNSTHFGRTR